MVVDYTQDLRYFHLTYEQVRRHYEVEKELRNILLNTLPEQRSEAFSWAYDELFRRIPWHPALTESSGANSPDLIKTRAGKIARLLPPGSLKLLEIGCGMGELMIGLSNIGHSCVGLDVSAARIERLKASENEDLKFVHSEGTHLPFNDNSFDVVISMQLFEHLHPDNALTHLREVGRVLKSGGKYLLETPNRLTGPNDISRFFVDTPEGFHLKEYSIQEVVGLFRLAGYHRIAVATWFKRVMSGHLAIIQEMIWSSFGKSFRRAHTMGLHNPLYIAEKIG